MRNVIAWALVASFLLAGCQGNSQPTPTPTGVATTVARASPSPASAPTNTPGPTQPTIAPTASTPPNSSPVTTAVASTSPTTPAVADQTIPPPPSRDLVDLRKRLGGGTETPVPTEPPGSDAVGSRYTFWVANQANRTYFKMPALVAYRAAHTVWYVQDGVSVSQDQITAAANYFETKTYPTEHQLFGSEATPGTPPLITILVGHIPDVGGYFSSADEYPRQVNPYSNQRKMIYINVDAVQPGSNNFNHTVAHEFQHMIQFSIHPDQNSWVDEGAAEFAALAVTGIPSATIGAFERAPGTQLNTWSSEPAAAIPHYGAAYLFMVYVSQHFGGATTIGKVIASPGRGMAAFSPVLQAAKPPTTFNQVFGDWVAANVVDDSSALGGRYGYQGVKLKPVVQNGPPIGQSTKGQATQFGTTYYRVQAAQPATLVFQGATTVQRIGGDPQGSRFEWWSNRGDSIDSRLTRSIDLRSVTRATLKFSAWYDIEDGYDFAYVETSTDGGTTWKTMPATTTTTDNPSGQNYGNGLTGESGSPAAQWVSEQVDLSSVAGKQVLLRFEYVTDDSYNGDGLALDGFSIPEIGWSDSVAADNGWIADGFVRTDNRETQDYLLEVIDPAGPAVDRVAVRSDGSATASLTAGTSYIVAVAGLAPETTHQSAYTLGIQK